MSPSCLSRGSVVDHSAIKQAPKKGLIGHGASDTGRVPRWKSSSPDRLAEATAEATDAKFAHHKPLDCPVSYDNKLY